MVAMCAATGPIRDTDVIDSEGLTKIVASSAATVAAMDERGRFDEEVLEPGVHR